MILLAVLLAPLGVAVLFIVMSWTERTLDTQLRHQLTATAARDASLADTLAAVDPAVLLEQAAAQ